MTPERARELLDEEERRLRSMYDDERATLSDSLEDQIGELTAFDQHPADVGTETHDREVDESLLYSAEIGLEEVAAARRRLDDGTYGTCLACGAPIPDERLEAQPTARYCVRHQREHERQAGTVER